MHFCKVNEAVTNCNALKMKSADGKIHKTDCASTEQLVCIIQSIMPVIKQYISFLDSFQQAIQKDTGSICHLPLPCRQCM